MKRDVTRFGLGLAALGRPAYITLQHAGDFPRGRDLDSMELHAQGVLDGAWSAGIRYFDAARSYGHAERFLRRWIDSRRIKQEEIVVGSKWGYRYTGDWQIDGRVQEVKDHGAAMLETQFAESEAILGPYLRLYQIHSAAPETRVLERRDVLDELERLRERGLLLGVTTTGTRQLETIRRAMEIRVDSVPLFSAIQATFNLLERTAEPGLREAHQAGFKVLVKEALANGRLTSKGTAEKTGALRKVAEGLGGPVDAVALAFVLKQPWADVVLSGATTEAQLDSNLRALHVDLGPGDLQALEQLRTPAEEYWAERAKLPWN